VGHGQGTRYSASAANRPASSSAPPGCTALPASEAYLKISPSGRPGKRWPGFGTVIVGSLLAGTGWLVWRYFERVEVSGLSMAPALQPGDRLLLRRTRSVHPGDIVAASDPREPGRPVLKRVAGVNQEGVLLLGDNPEHSTDSRQFGRVPTTSVKGKAIYRYAPSGRAGKLP
jgi:nickel-type superoxide dismutase maturation protease